MIASIKLRLAAWHQQRETIRELSLMTDRELADLGIGRGDIPFVADGSLLAAQRASMPAAAPAATSALRQAANDTLIGPAWAAHAPTSLAA